MRFFFVMSGVFVFAYFDIWVSEKLESMCHISMKEFNFLPWIYHRFVCFDILESLFHFSPNPDLLFLYMDTRRLAYPNEVYTAYVTWPNLLHLKLYCCIQFQYS